MKEIIDSVGELHSAADLSDCLSVTVRDFKNHVIYVKLPDGSTVTSYEVEEETLSDGSKVYNLLLKGD